MKYALIEKLNSQTAQKFAAAILLGAALSFAAASTAFANDCADNIDLVTAAQISAGLSAKDNAKIESAEEAALAKYSSGDTDGCLAELAEAKIMLNLI